MDMCTKMSFFNPQKMRFSVFLHHIQTRIMLRSDKADGECKAHKARKNHPNEFF